MGIFNSIYCTFRKHTFTIFLKKLGRLSGGGKLIASQPLSHELQKPVRKSSKGNSKLKNIQLSIQETCNRTEHGKATIIDISKDLPETLSDWDRFVCAYYSQVGTVIKFVKIHAQRWSILKETEREMWTVGKWAQVSALFN